MNHTSSLKGDSNFSSIRNPVAFNRDCKKGGIFPVDHFVSYHIFREANQ